MRPPEFDTHALIARLRADDEEARQEAYRIVFGSQLGREVLADIALQAGVGGRYGGAPDLYSVGYHQGGHDHALEILDRARFDRASAIAMVMTGQLEGTVDETSATPGPDFADPEPIFGDDDGP